MAFEEKKVDFFIVGAPKCGTTALAMNLATNPHITLSDPKEPHFFTKDLFSWLEKPKDVDGYHSQYFPQQKSQGSIWGDGSVWTMVSEEALPNIAAYNPEARIIVMLRDPAKAAFSMHQMMVFQQHEDVRNFKEAWKLSDQRYMKKSLPKTLKRDHRMLAYKQTFTFMPQLKRVFDNFPAENVKVVTQEEYAKGGLDFLHEVTEFLHAPKFNYLANKTTNESRYMKEGMAMELMRHPMTIWAVGKTKKMLGIKSFGIGRPSARISASDAEMVYADLSDDIEAVKEQYGLDLVSKRK